MAAFLLKASLLAAVFVLACVTANAGPAQYAGHHQCRRQIAGTGANAQVYSDLDPAHNNLNFAAANPFPPAGPNHNDDDCPVILTSAAKDTRRASGTTQTGTHAGWNNHRASMQFYHSGPTAAAAPAQQCLFASVHYPRRLLSDVNYCFQIGQLNAYKDDPEYCLMATVLDMSTDTAVSHANCANVWNPLTRSQASRSQQADIKICADRASAASRACINRMRTYVANAVAPGAGALPPWFQRRLRHYTTVQEAFDWHRKRRIGLAAGNFQALIEGEAYMNSVAAAIQGANNRIYIAGWGLNAHVRLTNPCPAAVGGGAAPPCTLLEELRARMTAQAGLEVRILLYHSNRAIDYWSDIRQEAMTARTQFMTLNGLNTGTMDVVLHPNTITEGKFHPRAWSHHNKVVLVDDNISFVGGIDMTTRTARYDRLGNPVANLAAATAPLADPRVPTQAHNAWRMSPRPDGTAQARAPSYPGISWHDLAVRVVSNKINSDLRRWFLTRQLSNSEGVHANAVLMREDADFETRYSKYAYLLEEGANPGGDIISRGAPGAHGLHATVITSLAEWSGNPNRKETAVGYHSGAELDNSIYRHWADLIDTAEHFVYIEQQYFLSRFTQNFKYDELAGGPREDAINDISIRLLQRIKTAIDDATNPHFTVIFLLPYVADYNQAAGMKRTIYGFRRAVDLARKMSAVNNPNVNVRFFSPRSFEVRAAGGGTQRHLDTTPVYVHDKLLIVDGMRAVIGSANINDRSMSGDGDSEMALFLEDYRAAPANQVWIMMRDLMVEHLGNAAASPAVHPPNWVNILGDFDVQAAQNWNCFQEVSTPFQTPPYGPGAEQFDFGGQHGIGLEHENVQRFLFDTATTVHCNALVPNTGSQIVPHPFNLFPDKTEFRMGFSSAVLAYAHQRFKEEREDVAGDEASESLQSNTDFLEVGGATDTDTKAGDEPRMRRNKTGKKGQRRKTKGGGDDRVLTRTKKAGEGSSKGKGGEKEKEKGKKKNKAADEKRNGEREGGPGKDLDKGTDMLDGGFFFGFDDVTVPETARQLDKESKERNGDVDDEVKIDVWMEEAGKYNDEHKSGLEKEGNGEEMGEYGKKMGEHQFAMWYGFSEAVRAVDSLRKRSLRFVGPDINDLEKWREGQPNWFDKETRKCTDKHCLELLRVAREQIKEHVVSEEEVNAILDVLKDECGAVDPHCADELAVELHKDEPDDVDEPGGDGPVVRPKRERAPDDVDGVNLTRKEKTKNVLRKESGEQRARG